MVKNIEGLGKSFFVKQYESASRPEGDTTFKKTLNQLVDSMGALDSNAKSNVQAVMMGAPVESHDIMIAAQEAGLAFDLMLEVRNKLIEAYQELMRMQF